MAQNSIFDMSTTPATNVDINGIGVIGSSLVSTADDAFRNLESLLRKSANDLGGLVTVGGTANAITVTSSAPNSYSALTTGLYFRFRPSATNTAATTLNLDALGAKAVRKIINGADVALAAGDLVSGVPVFAMYLSTANAAAGGWIITPAANLNAVDGTAALPAYSFDQDQNTGFYRIAADEVGLSLGGALAWDFGQQVTTYSWADNGAATGPFITLDRNSASPAASDLIGGFSMTGRTSTGVTATYGQWLTRITSATNGSQTSRITVSGMNSGTGVAYLDMTGTVVTFGDFTTPVGISVTGGQVQFPATRVPSADVNNLDGYEEGTFTPVISGTTLAGVGTYTQQSGNFTRIGNTVTFSITASITAHTGTGNMIVTGLPYTALNGGADYAVAFNYAALTFTGVPSAFINANTSQVTLVDRTTGGNGVLAMDTSCSLRITGTYFTT